MAHVEFHRRHQSVDDLTVDLAEAQIRLFRRDKRQVLSLLWDLYGARDEPVLQRRALDYGAKLDDPSVRSTDGSRAVYLRVNLRGLPWEKLLAEGPPALWPLVTLARDGANEEAVHRARDAIEARTELRAAERADHLAVLWFVAEAEKLPVRVMRAYISEERLMESTLYQSIFEKGEAKGEAEGEAKGKAEAYAETILRLLTHWMDALDPAVQDRIRKTSDLEILKPWHDEALFLRDAEGAQQLAEKIRNAPLA